MNYSRQVRGSVAGSLHTVSGTKPTIIMLVEHRVAVQCVFDHCFFPHCNGRMLVRCVSPTFPLWQPPSSYSGVSDMTRRSRYPTTYQLQRMFDFSIGFWCPVLLDTKKTHFASVCLEVGMFPTVSPGGVTNTGLIKSFTDSGELCEMISKGDGGISCSTTHTPSERT